MIRTHNRFNRNSIIRNVNRGPQTSNRRQHRTKQVTDNANQVSVRNPFLLLPSTINANSKLTITPMTNGHTVNNRIDLRPLLHTSFRRRTNNRMVTMDIKVQTRSHVSISRLPARRHRSIKVKRNTFVKWRRTVVILQRVYIVKGHAHVQRFRVRPMRIRIEHSSISTHVLRVQQRRYSLTNLSVRNPLPCPR